MKALVLLGADPVRDVPDARLAEEGLAAAEFVVAIDLFVTDSVRHADVVFPAVGATEKEGTATNLEGRVQKVNRIAPGPGQSRSDWSILDDLSESLGRPLGLVSPEAIAKEIESVAPAYAGLTWSLLEWDETDGAVVPFGSARQPLEYLPTAAKLESTRAPLVLHSARTLSDDGVMLRAGLSQHHLAPGPIVHLSPADALAAGVPAGGIVMIGEHELEAIIDPTIHQGVVYLPFNQPGGPSLGTGLEIKVKAKR